MKIIIEVENREDFDPSTFMNWMNRWLGDVNGGVGGTYWARLIGTIGEDDETD